MCSSLGISSSLGERLPVFGLEHSGAMSDERGSESAPELGFLTNSTHPSGNPEEAELMRSLASGSDAAMAILFSKYHRLVRSIAHRIVRDSAEAEDVVQIVFLDLFRAAASFDDRKGSIQTWVLQYAYHRALHRKRHLVANRFYEWDDVGSLPQRRRGFEAPESQILVQQLLAFLNDAQKDVVEMMYLEGFTAEEISFRRGRSVHVVRHDLRRGISAMRERAGSSSSWVKPART